MTKAFIARGLSALLAFFAATAVEAQTLTIGDAAVTEGDAGLTAAVFDVTLTGISPLTVQVAFATEDGTATVADGDYLATAGTLSFQGPGTRQVVVEIFGDNRAEGNDVFFVTLSNAVNATIADGQGNGTIFNDDFAELTIDDVTVTEGDSGTTNAVFNVGLSAPSAEPMLVAWNTRDGTATAGADYAAAAGTVLFAPGQTQRTVTVEVLGDVLTEADETFFVDVSFPDLPLRIGPVSGRGTILDDDMASLSIGDVTVVEGDSGIVEATFDVTLSNAAAGTVTVGYATRDGTATSGADYTPTAGTLTFPPGETSRTLVVEVLGDELVEGDETFFVDLSGATGAGITDGEGMGTIDDDDDAGLSIGDVTVTEGDTGTVEAAFEITLSPAAAQTVTVDFATRDGTAAAGSDYTAAAGTLTFAGGETSQTVSITVLGDELVEGDESFFVDLAGADGAEIADGEGRGTIADDDMTGFSISDATVGEADPAAEVTFEVTLSSPASKPLTVDFTTTDGTATHNVDYAFTAGTLTFPAGVTARTITVEIFDDPFVEDDETFFVDLANPSGGAAIADGRGRGTLVDDDEEESRIRFAAVPAAMENGGAATVTVERLGGAGEAARVTVRARPGTASDGADFTAAARTLEWAAGELGNRAFMVEISDDRLEEADETVIVELVNPIGASLAGPARRDLVILDDDTPMLLQIVGDAELSAAAGGEVELRVQTLRDDDAPVAGAQVEWAADGDGELRDGELTTTGDEGMAVQRLGLGNRPGEVTVTARIAGLDASATFRVTVTGNLGDSVDRDRDPGAAGVADTLDQACIGADGELDDLCDFLYSLDGPDRDRMLAALTPEQVSAQGTLALESQRHHLASLARRMAEVRRGARTRTGGGLGVALHGTHLDVSGLIAALRRSAATPVAALPVAATSLRTTSPMTTSSMTTALPASLDDPMPQPGDAGSPIDAVDDLGDGGPRLGFFLNGQLSFGDRPTVRGETGFDFDTSGLTAGLDYLVNDRFFIGGAVGYVDTDTELAGGSGELDVRGLTLSIYASYYLTRFYVDGALSYGDQEYDTVRNVDLPQPFQGRDRFVAVAEPGGNQLSVSLGAGYDAALGAWSVGGFGRLSSVTADIDAYAESGAGAFDLAFAEQTAESLLAEAGVEITYAASMSWGVLLPSLRLAALHEFDDDLRLIRARFAKDLSGIDFVVPTTSPDRDFLNLSAGFTATLPRGRTLFLVYDTDLGRDDLDVSTVTVGLRLEL